MKIYVPLALLLLFVMVGSSSANYFGENEPNDTMAQANEFSLGINISGDLSASADVDYFKFYVPKAGELPFRITNEYNVGDPSGGIFSIVDEAGVILASATNSVNPMALEAHVSLPGFYYLQVKSSEDIVTRKYYDVHTGFASDFTLIGVIKTGPGSGTVTSSPPGINCGLNCAANFKRGTLVTLTATADKGSVFLGWPGWCWNTVGFCSLDTTFFLSSTVTAQFGIRGIAPVNYLLLGK